MADVFDLWAALPHGPALAAAQTSGTVGEVIELLRAGAGAPDHLSAVRRVSANLAWAPALDAVAHGSDDPLLRAVHASSFIDRAWHARGRGGADTVTAEAWATSTAYLERAEQQLADLCLDDDPLAWSLRVTTSRELNLGLSETRRRYDRAIGAGAVADALDPDFLQDALPRWHGSWEQAEGFVAERRGAAAPGELAHALGAHLDVERWLEAKEDGGRTPDWVREPATAAGWREAAIASVWHPEHRESALTADAHATFALLFSAGGFLEEAAAHFRALGEPARSRQSWSYFTHTEAKFTASREVAYGLKPPTVLPIEPGAAPGTARGPAVPSPGQGAPAGLVATGAASGTGDAANTGPKLPAPAARGSGPRWRLRRSTPRPVNAVRRRRPSPPRPRGAPRRAWGRSRRSARGPATAARAAARRG